MSDADFNDTHEEPPNAVVHHQQHTAQLQWRPDCPVEHVVVLCEAGVITETSDAERGSDGAPAWRQDGYDEKQLSFTHVLWRNRVE